MAKRFTHVPHSAQRGAEDGFNPLPTSCGQTCLLHRRDQHSIHEMLGSTRVIRQIHSCIMHLSGARLIFRTLFKRRCIVDLDLSTQHGVENGLPPESEGAGRTGRSEDDGIGCTHAESSTLSPTWPSAHNAPSTFTLKSKR